MTGFQKFKVFCLLTALVSGLPSLAAAQSTYNDEEEEKKGSGFVYQYSKKYRPVIDDGVEVPISVLGKGYVVYMLVRDEQGMPGDFFLRVTSPVRVSGCAHIEDPEIEVRKTPPLLQLEINEATAIAKKGKRYSHYDCAQGKGFGHTDIPLNRDELMDAGINKVTMRSTVGPYYENLDMTVTESRVELSGPRGSAKLWFYPENTVLLEAPTLKSSQDVSADILKQGRAKGLVPLREVLGDFEPDERIKHASAYFLDPMGLLHREIEVAGKSVFVGNIEAQETFFGPQGKYQRPKQVPLYAKIPGIGE